MPKSADVFRGQAGLDLARATVDELGAHGIPTTPENYETWITHKSGRNADLSREIETLVAKGAAFDDATTAALFERHFANTRLAVHVTQASTGIARELTEVVENLRDAGELAGGFASELDHATQAIDDATDLTALSAVVTRLAHATREVAENNRQLEQRMQASSRQVEALQVKLDDVRMEALTDGLTGLANRKHFDVVLDQRIDEALESGAPLCLLMSDIDRFKSINDTYGHVVGDQVIRFVARTLQVLAPEDALACRYGGEEFALILPRTNLTDAVELGRELNNKVKSQQLIRRSTNERLGRVTISVGVTTYQFSESAAELLRRADERLYTSKHHGRDQVTADEVPLCSIA